MPNDQEIEDFKKQFVENQKGIEELNQKLNRKTREVEIIQSISSEILNTLDLDLIFERIMKVMDEVFGFKHAMILMVEENSEILKVVASRGYEEGGIGATVEFGKGVIGVVAKKRKIMRMVGISTQMRYAGQVGQSLGMEEKKIELPGLKDAKSQIAIPLLVKEKLLGVFAVESEEINAFKLLDEMILSIVGNQIAVAIENAAAYHTQQQLSEAYSRFVPKELLSLLSKRSILETQLADQTEGLMTVMFSDIRGFTTLSETMTPNENFRFINDYLGMIAPVIKEHHGFIDKFIGDAIMAIFPSRAEDAVEASLAMMRALQRFNDLRKGKNQNPIDIGIGIHTGHLMLGIIGHENRMEGTVIGDSVNLASRVEGLTKEFKCSIIASEVTIASLKDKERFQHKFLDEVKVKGKSQAVKVYKIESPV
ncbi:adenylate/guanylate cyclase domain-containing protein [Leptospira yasudae]|uniref:GAF domain-containing protein n=1 Tax=Leptospira yasudae TaxID=2202201 RepID=A0A6N4QTG1_9LEPT|nr:adenylate/guanylate cyclase domain-containing protein [Leptospira yasudae]TGL77424.1 GAF domain-containing protein [Leptospira yasudae]TGL81950.1 GAF domain-containing protein [Leptospira yasudae]TGL84739.1 GAF domain-containing protein [Leptospira yasudae]